MLEVLVMTLAGRLFTKIYIFSLTGVGAEIDVGSAVGCGIVCATGAGVLGDIGDGTGEGGVGEGEPEQPHATSIVTPSMPERKCVRAEHSPLV